MSKTKSPLSHEKCIEILNLTYSRIMRLKFSHMFLSTIIHSYNIPNRFPNLCYSLKLSFVTDAYTTVSGIYSSGTKSLQNLQYNNANIKDAISKSNSTISKTIPCFRDYRNQIFCHLNKQYNSVAINAMLDNFNLVLNELCRLHAECCQILSVSDKEINGYPSEAFIKLQQEAYDFCDMLMHGYFDKISEEIQDKLETSMQNKNTTTKNKHP